MALTPFTSRIIADTGISMGDEGKGRLVAELIQELREIQDHSAPVAVVLKVNGGANSGHTAGGIKLNLLPAAVIEKSVPVLAIGMGVVADPRKFLWELRPLEHRGYRILSRLIIDERTQVSDLSHRLLDLAWEEYRTGVLSEPKVGTTGRGITPAFQEEVGRTQIFFSAFQGPRATFAGKLEQRLQRAINTIRYVCQVSDSSWHAFFDVLTQAEIAANAEAIEQGTYPEEEFDFTRFCGKQPFTLNIDAIVNAYWRAGRALVNNLGDVRECILGALSDEKYVVGEFGQSFWLDKRFGFSPNTTASHTYTPEFFQSAGIPIQPIHTVGVCKAYDTKVGTHVFHTQFPDVHPLAEKLKLLEFGTSTGRQRMVGWFNAVEKGETLRYGGFQDLVINKLDALSYGDSWHEGELLICVAYRYPDGSIQKRIPRDPELHAKLCPVYQQFPGWAEDISGVRNFRDLPENAQRYAGAMMKYILDAAYCDCPIPAFPPNLRYIGVGPDPAQIIKDIPATRELIRLAEPVPAPA